MSDTQDKLAEISPSSISLAEPANEITVAESKEELSKGPDIETTGELFVTDIPGYRVLIASMSSCSKMRFTF